MGCVCFGGSGRLGVPNCLQRLTVKRRVIITPLYQSNGLRTSIPLSAFDPVTGILPDSFIQGKLDGSEGWEITPDTFEEVTPGVTEDGVQTSTAGTVRILRSGVKIDDVQLWEVPTSFSELIKSKRCQQNGIFIIDDEGKLGCEVSDDGLSVYPFAVQKNTLNAVDMDQGEGEGQFTRMTWQLDRIVNLANWFVIGADKIETNLLTATSLIESTLTAGPTATTDTDVYVTLTTFDHTGVVGQDQITDWSVLDGALATVVISAVEEVNPELKTGEYKLTITSTPAETLTVDYVKVRTSSVAILHDAKAIQISTP